jgi:hypothetical protein
MPRPDAAVQSEWLKVMLAEVARKQAEVREARAEDERRSRERELAEAAPAVLRTPARSRRR